MSPQFNSSRWSRWTDAEKAFLRENYNRLSLKDMAATLGRTPGATHMQAGSLGLCAPAATPWSNSEREFLRQGYRDGIPLAQMAEHLGRSRMTLVEQAGKLGLRASRGEDWTAEEDEYLRVNYAGTAAGELARYLGRTEGSVRRHGRRLGLVPDSERIRAARRTDIRHDYFSVIDTPLKAYVLGWLATDGYITNTVGITLSVKDLSAVELIRDELAPLHEIKFREAKDRRYGERVIRGGRSAEFRVSSARMREDLGRLGVVPRKSHVLQYPDIPARLDNSFVLGCLDGDGTLCSSRSRNGRYQWGLYSASLPFLVDVQAHVLEGVGIRLSGPTRQGTIHGLKCQHQERIRTLDAWLHADIPGLARKRLSADLRTHVGGVTP